MNTTIKDWLHRAGIRAIKTVAQSAAATVCSTAVLTEINWAVVGASALAAGIFSLLTSLKGLPEAGINQ